MVKGKLTLTIQDKGGKLFKFVIPKGKIMGVDYHKVFSEIQKMPKDTKILVDKNGKSLTDADIVSLGKKITGEGSTHIARDNIYEIAAELDLRQTKNSAGKWSDGFWTKMAKIFVCLLYTSPSPRDS